MKKNTNEAARKIFYGEIGKIQPLSDEHFKEIFEDESRFAEITELILGRKLGEEIINLNGEFRLMVKGRAIQMDYLYGTTKEIINIEAQNVTETFPFKRHLFYWAVAYAHTLKKGDEFTQLKPCTSIVIYKDKGECALRQTAKLEGSLIATKDDGEQLTLISINAAKWRSEKNEKLRCYLALLANGVQTPENAGEFEGVNTKSKYFKELNKYFTATSLVIRDNELENQGGNEMVRDILAKYWTEEQQMQAIAKGEKKGVKKGDRNRQIKTAKNLLKMGLSIEQVAQGSEMSEKEIIEIKKRLKL